MRPFHEELKELRIEKGISLEDIFRITKIRVSLLEKLEEGDFSIAPGPFLHAFLREYAEVIGIDPNRVIARFENKAQSIDETVPSVELKPEIIPPIAKDEESSSQIAGEKEKTADIHAGTPAPRPPLKVGFIDEEKPEEQQAELKEEYSNEQPHISSKTSLEIEEPRSSQGLLLGIFVIVIIIAAVIIIYVTGGIH
jgi:cytoskeletal protein RodZ